jgi:hypothetical protein
VYQVLRLVWCNKTHNKIKISKLHKFGEFWYIVEIYLTTTITTEQKKRLLKAKIAVALRDELGLVPTQKEINQVFLLTKVMYKARLGLHYRRKEQKKSGQLASF